MMDRVQESVVVFTSDKQLSFCADIPGVGAGGVGTYGRYIEQASGSKA